MVREHAGSSDGFDEPDDGWQSGPAMVDTVLMSVTLCRFTGLDTGPMCQARGVRHPDVDCQSTYVQQHAATTMSHAEIAAMPGEKRRPWSWPS